MKTYQCSTCGEAWPENYCPKCARTIERMVVPDELAVDGDIINGSWSTCAAKIRLNPARYLWFKPETRPFFQLWLALIAITMVAGCLRWWMTSGIFLILALPLTYVLWWIYRRVAEIYQNASLTAGMIVCEKPLEFISIANMDPGVGVNVYAVKRVRIPRLPCHPEAVGTLFPCVSGFQAGPTADRWGDFSPQPLSFGTGNIKSIQDRTNKLGDESFAQLKKVFKDKKYPKKSGEMIWLDQSDG